MKGAIYLIFGVRNVRFVSALVLYKPVRHVRFS